MSSLHLVAVKVSHPISSVDVSNLGCLSHIVLAVARAAREGLAQHEEPGVPMHACTEHKQSFVRALIACWYAAQSWTIALASQCGGQRV